MKERKQENPAPENQPQENNSTQGVTATVDDTPKKESAVKKALGSRALRAGSYSIIAIVIVIAIAVVANMLVGQLPAAATRVDLTQVQMLDFSEQTNKIVSNLKSPVTIYWLVQSGKEDTYLTETLSRYEDLSSNVKVEKKDPVMNPNFASQYTSSNTYQNSLVVVSGNRSKFVNATEIYVTNQDAMGTVTQVYDGEAAITSAIAYVTSESLPIIYTTTGHGEMELDETLQSAVTRQNMVTKSLNLVSAEAVPEDADCLLILSPVRDISTAEKKAIETYLAGGGHMLLVTDYTEEKLPNLVGLMSGYGVDLVDGIVIERDANHSLQNYPNYIIPTMPLHAITEPLINAGYPVMMPTAQGLTVQSDLRDGLSVTQMLRSTSQSYSKLAAYDMTTYEKEEGDIDGSFALGVAIEEPVQNGETRIVWLTTSEMLNPDIDEMVGGSNSDVFVNSLSWMSAREDSISILPKNLGTGQLTLTAAVKSMLGVLFIGVIPLGLMAVGVVIMVRRRAR